MALTGKELVKLCKAIAHSEKLNINGNPYVRLETVIDLVSDYSDERRASILANDSGWTLSWEPINAR